MSILIKGMKMPKRCLDCPFMVSRDNDDCVLQTEVENELARTWEELKASCPLVEIPTPHGRLIDADELKSKFRHGKGNSDTDSAWISTIRRAITQAETIIEAEGSETDA